MDVDYIEADEKFALPLTIKKSLNVHRGPLDLKNSMSFIGVDKVHGLKIQNETGETIAVRGAGVRVGIIDSGIDYTHEMLGGSGDPTAFESINPNETSDHFPNKKVVGGFDFAGESFNPGSHIYKARIPAPDANPLDQGGHGTHVAGTTAGVGDGVNTYDGAAPDADLYALKVFGDEGGGTSDTIVIAALEYAADPNGDLDPSDRLDVVNLSLGGAFGKPHNLYGRAIKNIVQWWYSGRGCCWKCWPSGQYRWSSEYR